MDDEQTRTDSGQYSEDYDESDFVSAVEATNGTTEAVAEEIGCSPVTARRRLEALWEDGRLTRDQIGGAWVYSRVQSA